MSANQSQTAAVDQNQATEAKPHHYRNGIEPNGYSYTPVDYSEEGKRVSEAEYWEHYYSHPSFSYEWNNGILEEKGMSDREQLRLHDWFFSILREYLKAYPIAYFIYLETGMRLALAHKTTIRKPDLFIIRNDNPVQYEVPDQTYHGICDIAIESVSDSTKAAIERDAVVKKGEYALAGVREYYILDVRHGNTNFYQLAGNIYHPIRPTADGVICSTVLPGFQFRLEHLVQQPDLLDLVDDPVYQGYMMLDYQAQRRLTDAARQEAEQAQQQAQQAQQEAQQAQQQTARLAAKLRELGIDPDQL
jgi:Uma2 family endonuclease